MVHDSHLDRIIAGTMTVLTAGLLLAVAIEALLWSIENAQQAVVVVAAVMAFVLLVYGVGYLMNNYVL